MNTVLKRDELYKHLRKLTGRLGHNLIRLEIAETDPSHMTHKQCAALENENEILRDQIEQIRTEINTLDGQ